MSKATAQAVDVFVRGIIADGLRDRFYRLNLFIGADLNAALVPLYRGPSTSGTQYGYEYDQNIGPFTSSDFTVTTGLQGDGETKYLNTGVTVSSINSQTAHMMIDKLTSSTIVNRSLSYAAVSTPSANRYGMTINTLVSFVWGGAQSAVSTSSGAGVYIGFCEATNSRKIYFNGTLEASNSLTSSGVLLDIPLLVFTGTLDSVVGLKSNIRLGGYSFGLALTPTQALAYNARLTALKASLSRS